MDSLREIIASFTTAFDGSETEKGQKHVEGFIGKLQEFGKVAAEAFAIYEVKEFTYGLAEQAEQLELHAQTLGISAEGLQKWQYAANIAGVSAEEMQLGLQRLQRSAVGAGQGGGELAGVFAKLHVDVKNASGGFKNADELLTDVAGAIGDMKDPTEQTAVAMQVFGRGGARLLPFFKQGREGMAALKEEVDKLGGGFSEEFIAKSTEMIQNMKRLDFAMTGLKTAAIGPLLPLITSLVGFLTKGAVSLGQLVKTSSIAQAALATFGTYGAFKAITGVVQLATKLGFLKNGLRGLVVEFAPLILGFLALEDIWTFFTGGESLTGDALDKLFGEGSAKKVQEFAAMLASDLGPVIHDVLAIFTDGKPLSEKFQELYAYIRNTLKPQFQADFGEMGNSIASVIEGAGQLAEALTKIIDAMKWVSDHTLKPITDLKATAQQQTQELNDAAASGKHIATDNEVRAARAQDPWYMKVLQAVAGFDANGPLAPQRVTAPGAPMPAPVVNDSRNQSIQIDVHLPPGTPAEQAKQLANEAGKNLRTMNALVPTAG